MTESTLEQTEPQDPKTRTDCLVQYFIDERVQNLNTDQREEYHVVSDNALQTMPVSTVGDRQLVRGVATPSTLCRIVEYLAGIGKDPVVLRVLNKNGMDYGIIRTVLFDEENNETVAIEGNAVWEPDMARYESFFPMETIEIDGVSVSQKRAENTESGWVI